jgi:hypothetical protein
MKKLALSLVSLSCLLLPSVNVWAGSFGPEPVTVNLTAKWAQGALGTARNSSDHNQQIECNSRATSAGSYWTYCYAVDAANNFISCYSPSPDISRIAASINGDSAVFFAADANNYCTTVIVYNGSSYEPKH